MPSRTIFLTPSPYFFPEVTLLNPDVCVLLRNDLKKFAFSINRPGGLRQPIERCVREVLIPSIAENFIEGGRPTEWEPLSPITIETRARKKGVSAPVRGKRQSEHGFIMATAKFMGSFTPLMDTGQLYSAAVALARWDMRGNEASFGNFPPKRWFGPVHDVGSANGHIPARPFAVIQIPKDVDACVEIFGEFLEEQIRKHTRPVYV